jgi:hypothetical protein
MLKNKERELVKEKGIEKNCCDYTLTYKVMGLNRTQEGKSG